MSSKAGHQIEPRYISRFPPTPSDRGAHEQQCFRTAVYCFLCVHLVRQLDYSTVFSPEGESKLKKALAIQLQHVNNTSSMSV